MSEITIKFDASLSKPSWVISVSGADAERFYERTVRVADDALKTTWNIFGGGADILFADLYDEDKTEAVIREALERWYRATFEKNTDNQVKKPFIQ